MAGASVDTTGSFVGNSAAAVVGTSVAITSTGASLVALIHRLLKAMLKQQKLQLTIVLF